MSKTKVYASWAHMKRRCENPADQAYSRYGGRGITVCSEWATFTQFYADMGDAPTKKHTLDRLDNNLGYSKQNCKWSTPKEQCRNQRTNVVLEFEGRSMCLAAWAEEIGIRTNTLWHRVRVKGWDIKDALTTPIKAQTKRIN